jgi:hypothetical protein
MAKFRYLEAEAETVTVRNISLRNVTSCYPVELQRRFEWTNICIFRGKKVETSNRTVTKNAVKQIYTWLHWVRIISSPGIYNRLYKAKSWSIRLVKAFPLIFFSNDFSDALWALSNKTPAYYRNSNSRLKFYTASRATVRALLSFHAKMASV